MFVVLTDVLSRTGLDLDPIEPNLTLDVNVILIRRCDDSDSIIRPQTEVSAVNPQWSPHGLLPGLPEDGIEQSGKSRASREAQREDEPCEMFHDLT